MTSKQSVEIEFVNHASVWFTNGNKSILSDPWYFGDIFHKGWLLIYENPEKEIRRILEKTDYIWLSHEHADHFSTGFFRKYLDQITEKKINIIFQNTKDKRIVNYLKGLDLNVIELDNNKKYNLDNDFTIQIHKSYFYDSALILSINGVKIFNINDCPIRKISEIKKFRNRFGDCDLLLSQFSYAAWKGGKKNIKWRKQAAQDKLEAISNQSNIFNAKYLVPFATFVRFANEYNSYLCDSVNTPTDLIKTGKKLKTKMIMMRPSEKQKVIELQQDVESINFWNAQYALIKNAPLLKYDNSQNVESLQASFAKYEERIFNNNSYWLISLVNKLKFIGAFLPVNFYLRDLDKTITVDLFKGINITNKDNADIEIHSESLDFIFKNDHGFDTLTINGCLEEMSKNGFKKFSKTFSIGNLNNLGIYINLGFLFNYSVLLIFIQKLSEISKKL